MSKIYDLKKGMKLTHRDKLNEIKKDLDHTQPGATHECKNCINWAGRCTTLNMIQINPEWCCQDWKRKFK